MDLSASDLDNICKMVVELFSENHSDTIANLWFSDLKLISLNENEAVMVTAKDTKKRIIKEKFLDEIKGYLTEVIGFEVKITVLSSEHSEIEISKENMDEFTRVERGEIPSGTIEVPADFKSEYTFDNFVVGASNKLASSAAMAVASKDLSSDEQKTLYNPLFIYGPSGVGKTHLLYAIMNRIFEKNPTKKIVYIKGEEFTNQLFDAIQRKTTTQFREKYRRADVLLIDDIHFVAGKITTQEELFNTFNAVYEDNKQIILTSDRPPHEIKTLEDRLRTRFMSGLIADIQLPDVDLRSAILQQKARQNNLDLSPEIISYLATNIPSSIRQLEGVIKKLGAIKLLEGGVFTIERVKNSIGEFLQTKASDTKIMDDIILAVSKKYNVSRDDILSSKRNQDIVLARHVCVYVARKMTRLSQHQIGKAINRDRTTVISSEEVMKNKIEAEPDFALDINEIISQIKG